MKKAEIMLDPLAAGWIYACLSEKAGMDASALDRNHLQWTVSRRCRALHLPSAAEYVDVLASSSEEVDALIDAVVIPETRFFRDPLVFEHLQRWIPRMMTEFPDGLRVLSAPCSTGQEAYSIGALLLDAGAKFRMDAFDISEMALATARKGVYPKAALRLLSAEQKRMLGGAEGDAWRMHSALRRSIHFERRNLARAESLAGERYHLILCRNLFIYLRPQARIALAQSLAAALLPGGRVVLGTADRVEEVERSFAAVRPAATFAFTLRADAAESEVPAVSNETAVSLLAQKGKRAGRAKRISAKPAAAPPVTSATDAPALYARAVQHREHGDLKKAEHRCRQALYLDPTFLPALELLEALWLHHPNVRMRRALAARIDRHRLAAPALPEERSYARKEAR